MVDVWSLTSCLSLCRSVIDPVSTRCGSTIVLNRTRSVHVAGVVNAVHANDVVAVYTRSCPLHVAVRPGQTVNITLYSFTRQHSNIAGSALVPAVESVTMTTSGISSTATPRDNIRPQRFCAGHVFVEEGDRNLGGPLCPGQQRDRHLYLSRGQHVTVYFTSQQRSSAGSASSAAAGRDSFFILKIEGILYAVCYPHLVIVP
jgi:hypothetical protein